MNHLHPHRLHHHSSDAFMAHLVAQHLKDDVKLSRFASSLDPSTDILSHLPPLAPNDQLKPRRCRTESDLSCILPVSSSSFRDEFGHAAAETYLVTKLAFTLLKCLGIGYRWLTKLGALGLYATLLLPGFIQVGYYYFFDKRIHRSIVYGPKPRNRLDLYLPVNCDSPKPVIVFITGGAWIIGYKAWGSLLGLQLVEKNVIVACIDYRNFPQGSVSDMVEDVMEGISFIYDNIKSYGGDPNRLYLAGQSAGAHLAACALVEQAIKESCLNKGLDATGNTEGFVPEIRWRASQFRAYFGISGGYNLKNLVDHFHNRGLYRSLFLSIMEGEQSLLRYSPELRVQCLAENARSLLPPFFLLHGTADISIPSLSSSSFADVLASMRVQVMTKLYEGKTHTDVFLQDPLRGGHDVLLKDILHVIHAGDKEVGLINARPRLVPEFLLQLARRISPF